MKKTLLTSLSILALLLAGCSSDGASDGASNTTATESSSELVPDSPDGDNSEASITFNGSSTLAPVISDISMNYIEEFGTWDAVDSSLPKENIAIYVSAGGSGAGAKAVIDGTSDFGMVSRNVKDEEKAAIDDYQEIQLGLDALTISVNPDNPILQVKDDISTAELQKIFSGEYKTWNEVDESLPEQEIVVVTRDLSGGAHEVFQDNVMGDKQVKADSIQSPSMGALVQKIIENENAIGYASYGMVNQHKDELVPIKVDGVEATKENIVSGDYKIARPLLVIYSGELSATQQAFMDVLTGEEGMKILEDMGFVPMN